MRRYGIYILLGINLLLLFKFYTISNGYSVEKSLLTEKVNELSYKHLLLQDDVILSKQGSCQLERDMLLYTKDGDSIRFSEMDREENTLVLRYSALCCSSCVESILSKMRDFEKQYPNIDILLLTTYRVAAEKDSFKRICKLFPKVYNVFSLQIPLDDEIIPYLFILDKDMRIVDTFIPHWELPELTNRYFEKVAMNLSNIKRKRLQ